MMISPFESVEFRDMNKKQAQEYFDWYIGQADYRVNLLLNAVKEDGIDADFDYSVESLIPLWEWYEDKISYRKLDEVDYQARIYRNKYISISVINTSYEEIVDIAKDWLK